MKPTEVTEYNAIFEWNMTPQEAAAYKLALCYEKEYRRLFPDRSDRQSIRRNKLPNRTDPRKSYLFRYCWKLLRETRGLLESHEYKDYIYANLLIIKLNNGHCEPNAICGDKAWIRYKVWKRYFDRKMAEINATAPPPSVSTTNPKIIAQIDRTKKFLFERCDGEVTLDKIKSFLDQGIFKFWVATGKVSQFYVILSPYVQKAGVAADIAQQCGFSLAVLEEKTTQEVKDYFKHEYAHEFK
jgi:hypothetical protein